MSSRRISWIEYVSACFDPTAAGKLRIQLSTRSPEPTRPLTPTISMIVCLKSRYSTSWLRKRVKWFASLGDLCVGGYDGQKRYFLKAHSSRTGAPSATGIPGNSSQQVCFVSFSMSSCLMIAFSALSMATIASSCCILLSGSICAVYILLNIIIYPILTHLDLSKLLEASHSPAAPRRPASPPPQPSEISGVPSQIMTGLSRNFVEIRSEKCPFH